MNTSMELFDKKKKKERERIICYPIVAF
jgi:hypothetical protein